VEGVVLGSRELAFVTRPVRFWPSTVAVKLTYSFSNHSDTGNPWASHPAVQLNRKELVLQAWKSGLLSSLFFPRPPESVICSKLIDHGVLNVSLLGTQGLDLPSHSAVGDGKLHRTLGASVKGPVNVDP
jgi:hypothetical protein